MHRVHAGTRELGDLDVVRVGSSSPIRPYRRDVFLHIIGVGRPVDQTPRCVEQTKVVVRVRLTVEEDGQVLSVENVNGVVIHSILAIEASRQGSIVLVSEIDRRRQFLSGIRARTSVRSCTETSDHRADVDGRRTVGDVVSLGAFCHVVVCVHLNRPEVCTVGDVVRNRDQRRHLLARVGRQHRSRFREFIGILVLQPMDVP